VKILRSLFFLGFLLLPLLFVKPMKVVIPGLQDKAAVSGVSASHFDASRSFFFDEQNDMDIDDDDDINESFIHVIAFVATAIFLFCISSFILYSERARNRHAHAFIPLRSRPGYLQVFRI
jgi:hypothetical protein